MPAEGSEIFLLPLAWGQTCRTWVCANLVCRDRTHVNKTCSAPSTGSAFEPLVPMKRAWQTWAPWRLDPGEKQGCVCVRRSLGGLKTRAGLWQYRGGTKLLLCYCCRRKKDQERVRTFWRHLKFGLQVSCAADPMFSCPASRSATGFLGIFRGSNARAHEGVWTVILFPLCSVTSDSLV